jgi:hypothetical protein
LNSSAPEGNVVHAPIVAIWNRIIAKHFYLILISFWDDQYKKSYWNVLWSWRQIYSVRSKLFIYGFHCYSWGESKDLHRKSMT